MKIKWLNHPTKPELNGSVEHVSRTLAEIAIGYQQAVFVPFKNYVERLNEESKLRTAQPGDTVVPNVYPPRWEIGTVPVTKKVAIYYLAGTERCCFLSLVWYDNNGNEHPVPALEDCPKEIRQQFKELQAAEARAASGADASDRAERQNRDDHEAKVGTTRFFGRLGIDASSLFHG